MSDRSASADLFAFAEQASRIVRYWAGSPETANDSDLILAARIGSVSAQQIAIVRRVLLRLGLLKGDEFSSEFRCSRRELLHISSKLEGVAEYTRYYRDADTVKLVITEPGEQSSFRRELDKQNAVHPLLFDTPDAFINLAHSANEQIAVLMPFIDNRGAELLSKLFGSSASHVTRILICRPLGESHCGPAVLARRDDFIDLDVHVFEYALAAPLPSGRETFHAKLVLADDARAYIGSSNLQASALERSLELGVIVSGDTCRHLHRVISAVMAVARPVQL